MSQKQEYLPPKSPDREMDKRVVSKFKVAKNTPVEAEKEVQTTRTVYLKVRCALCNEHQHHLEPHEVDNDSSVQDGDVIRVSHELRSPVYPG